MSKKQRGYKNNKRLGLSSAIFLMVVVCFIALIPSVSALEFDNVKSYDSNTRIVTIKNAFGLGDTIGQARLLTPLNVKVGLGYQQVAEFELSAYQDYNDALKQFTFTDLKKKEKVNRDIDIKYLSYEDVIVDNYKDIITGYTENRTAITEKVKDGSHIESRKVWNKITPADLKENEVLTIGIFTDVQEGDYVDWIPTIYGVEVEEWATWTADLNTNLISYWAMEDASGDIQDSTANNNDLTAYNTPTYQATGKVNYGIELDGTNEYLSSTDTDLQPVHQTLSFWIKSDDATWDDYSQVGNYDGSGGLRIFFRSGTTNIDGHFGSVGGISFFSQYDVGTITDWNYIVATYDGTTAKLYINGINKENNTDVSGDLTYSDDTFLVGTQMGYIGTRVLDGNVDEIDIYSRALSQSEITQKYNAGTGLTWTDVFNTAPITTLISPTNTTNYTTSPQSVDFTCYGSDDVDFTEMEFYLDGALTQTNSSGLNNTNYIFTESLTDGDYNWSCTGIDDEAEETESEVWFLTVDTTPFIEFLTPPTLVNYANITQEYIPIKINTTTTQFENISFDLYNINGTTYSLFYETETFDINFTDIPDAHYHYNVTICATTGKCNSTETRHINHDGTLPLITLEAPTGNLNYGVIGNNETLNVTITDVNLESCWYNYNGTNITIDGCVSGIKNSTTFSIETSNTNLTIYANDTFGNENSAYTSWDYYIFEIAQAYDSEVIEGSTSLFSTNLTLIPTLRLSTANLIYNGTSYSATTNEYSTNNYYIYRTLNIPSVSADVNASFYWSLTFEDTTSSSTDTLNQTILNLVIDDCSAGAFQIFNLSMVDEATQLSLAAATENTSIKVDLGLSYVDGSAEVINYSHFFDEVNPARVCSNVAVGNSTFLLDAVIEYSSGERFVEFYNIQDYTFTNATASQNITLYNLKESEGQEFKITYKGTDFVPVTDLLIQIQRKYIEEGEFKIIEIPMSGSNGYTIAHLVANDVIYNLIFIENGVILDTFLDVIPSCQNPTITECEINLNALITGSNMLDIITEGDFFASLEFNKTTRVVSSLFGIISGASGLVDLNVSMWDNFGNRSACSDSLNAAGGLLSCIVPDAFGNSTIYAKVTYGGIIRRDGFISMADTPKDQYGGILIFASLILVMFVLGIGISDNPAITGIFLILGALLLVGLNLVYSTSIIGAGATILWFIVAVIVVIIKGSGKR